jgi:hypothetical protein
MKKDIFWPSIVLVIVMVFALKLTLVGIRDLWLSYNDKTEIEKKEVVKHERHKNILHDGGKTTEVLSHTIRYGDTMTIEIDTFIYR